MVQSKSLATLNIDYFIKVSIGILIVRIYIGGYVSIVGSFTVNEVGVAHM